MRQHIHAVFINRVHTKTMEPIKKQNNILAGFAALGVVAATAIAVFASTFNPPPQTVPADTAAAPDTANPASVAPPVSETATTAPALPAFGSVFPAPSTSSNSASATASPGRTVVA